jgi:(E)-4-hydroxy-3-methylbut-2-enyl-diphosphate synthase
VGRVLLGGDHPVVVQSMTNTDTADAAGTAEQVATLARAGSEIVRITVNTKAPPRRCPRSAPARRPGARRAARRRLPLQRPPAAARVPPRTAEALAKYRINPGNVGVGERHDANFVTMIEVAKEHDRRCASA